MSSTNSAIRRWTYSATIMVSIGLASGDLKAAEAADAAKGHDLYRACGACHSLVPGRHMTGPSLAGIWGKKAGTVEGFKRYSDAVKRADIIWSEETLDRWLADPKTLIPGNRMTFRGLADRTQRRDLIAFLRQVSEGGASAVSGAMGQRELLDLKTLDANNRVTAIGHCGDTYTVSVENGDAYPFWEFNLRFKTDASDHGPLAGHPVIIPASMSGDRAFVIFATPAEISPFIKETC